MSGAPATSRARSRNRSGVDLPRMWRTRVSWSVRRVLAADDAAQPRHDAVGQTDIGQAELVDRPDRPAGPTHAKTLGQQLPDRIGQMHAAVGSPQPDHDRSG